MDYGSWTTQLTKLSNKNNNNNVSNQNGSNNNSNENYNNNNGTTNNTSFLRDSIDDKKQKCKNK